MAAPRSQRKDAGVPASPLQNHVWRDFGGINTQAARQALTENEFAWIENVMPIGHGNLQILPARSLALAHVGNGECYYQKSYNIGGANFMFMATDSGHAYQVALASPYTVTEITTSGSPELATSGVTIAQWKNERIVIGDPLTGLWSWDGSTLTHVTGTIPSVKIDDPGVNFTTAPTMVFTGGGGTLVAADATLAVVQAILHTAGTLYSAGDVLDIVGGTETVVAQFRVNSVDGGGGITAFSIFNAGVYTVAPANPASVTGGTGSGAKIDLTFGVGAVVMTNVGKDYTSAPAVAASGGGGTNAIFTAVFSTAPPTIDKIEVFSDRVWATKNRTLNESAPDSYVDWSSANGGGTTIITDPTLHSDITQLIAANNFLYFIGIDSVNVIGDVQVNANGDTIFSNVNLSASIGSDLPLTAIPYFRSVWFANHSGLYSLYGATPTKASDPLDGIFRKIDFSKSVSGGSVMLENILCAAFMFNYVDSVLGARSLMALFFNRKWFLASQGDLKLIASGQQGGTENLYGTDGTNLYRLFADSETGVEWTLVSAYWDKGDPTRGKQVVAAGFELDISDVDGTIHYSIDALGVEGPTQQSITQDVDVAALLQFVNNNDEDIIFVNDSDEEIDFFGVGYVMRLFDAENDGKYIGVTMSSSDVRGALNSALLRYAWRETW